MGGTSVTIDCCETKSLDAEEIAKELLNSGAAHKPTRYEFGGDEVYELDKPKKEEEDNNGGDYKNDEDNNNGGGYEDNNDGGNDGGGYEDTGDGNNDGGDE